MHSCFEDIGLADPQAMVQAAAAAEITQLIGLPEALFPLSQATIYLARAPKSNAVKKAYGAAVADALETAREPVPLHLRNAPTPLMKRLGYGEVIVTCTAIRKLKRRCPACPRVCVVEFITSRKNPGITNNLYERFPGVHYRRNTIQVSPNQETESTTRNNESSVEQ